MVIPKARNAAFPVVGIGASAGGLHAFIELLKNLPADAGMAYVFIQHLDPAHKSMLVDILSRETSMPVAEVKKGMSLMPDRVYITPSQKNVKLSSGRFHLVRRPSGAQPPSSFPEQDMTVRRGRRLSSATEALPLVRTRDRPNMMACPNMRLPPNALIMCCGPRALPGSLLA